MLISEYITSIRADFENMSALASQETASVIERLALTLEPSFQKHLLDALNSLVQEHNVANAAPLTLTVEGDDVRLTRLVSPEVEDSTPPSNYSARIALRLSDELKESIESLASEVGSSVNSWIVRSLERTVRQDVPTSGFTGKRQLRGRGRA
ncbi:MAG TPA: toxin-antitoxin system HicB family antitoxin [Acidimicrobiales bacterium]|nr:toxin-antitoxin system HicB family antitoxin [Acidimicrobiales bacterium]